MKTEEAQVMIGLETGLETDSEGIKRSEDMDIGLYFLHTDEFNYLLSKGDRGLKRILALDYYLSKTGECEL